jgi:hypothetical protein
MPHKNKEQGAAYNKAYQRKNADLRKSVKLARREKHLLEGFEQVCNSCGLLLHISNYYLNSKFCKSCHKKRSKIWNAKNVEKRRAMARKSHLKTKFALTLEEQDQLLKSQNRSCAICSTENNLCIDHCHKTGKIRKILCRKCNSGLGMFNDDIELIEKALKYMNDHL